MKNFTCSSHGIPWGIKPERYSAGSPIFCDNSRVYGFILIFDRVDIGDLCVVLATLGYG